MKVKLGIKVIKLVESLIGREVTVGQGSECHLTFVRGLLHIAQQDPRQTQAICQAHDDGDDIWRHSLSLWSVPGRSPKQWLWNYQPYDNKKCRKMRDWLQDGDTFIVDRGCRDSSDFLADIGLRMEMSSVLVRGASKHTTEESNNSRLVTKVHLIAPNFSCDKKWC